MLLYPYGSVSRPLDAELRPVLQYKLQAQAFVANVTGTFDGLPIYDENGYPRRALSESAGDNFTMIALPLAERALEIQIEDRLECPIPTPDATTEDRRIRFARGVDPTLYE